MIIPPRPVDENQRLRALRSLALLDIEADERFDRVTRIAQRMFGVPVALVSLVDDDRQVFVSRQGLLERESPRDVSFCAHAINHDHVMTVADATEDERFRDNPLVIDDPGIRFYAGCPIKGPDGATLGTLCVIDRQPRSFSESEELILRDLAAIVEAEVASADLATTDDLTGLANRRGFDVVARKTLAVGERHDLPMTLLYADLDGLKEVNDAKGHDVGDQLIVAFAQVLASTFRRSDVIARLGGDEFAVLFSGTAAFDTVVQHLEDALAAHNEDPGPGGPLAVSYGVTTLPGGQRASLVELMARADEAMYEDKDRGRQERDRG